MNDTFRAFSRRSPRLVLAAVILFLAACAARPPTAADIAAKTFEPVAGQAVVYLVRPHLDMTEDQTGVQLDDKMMGTTYPGTYFRWVIAPGAHRIEGFAGDSGRMSLHTEAGRIYYVEQTTSRLLGFATSYFRLLSEAAGRAEVQRSELIE